MRIIKGDITNDDTLQLVLHEMANIETNTYNYDTNNASIAPVVKPVRGYPSYNYGNQTFTIKARVGTIFVPQDVSITRTINKIYSEYPKVISKLIPEFATGKKTESLVESNSSVDVMKKKKVMSHGFACQNNLSQFIYYNSVVVSADFYRRMANRSSCAKFIWVVDHSRKLASSESDELLASILLDTYDSTTYKHCQLVDQFDLSNLKPINSADFTLTISTIVHPTLVELECGITGNPARSRWMTNSVKCKRVNDLMSLGINVVLPDVCENCRIPFIGDVVVPVARRGEANYKFVCQRCIGSNRAKLNGIAYDYNIIAARRSIPDLINEYIADPNKRNILLGLDKVGDVECDARFGFYYRIHHTATNQGVDTEDKKYLLVNNIELFMMSGKANEFADYTIVKYEIVSG
ncbi:hypothetical protein F-VV10_0365 [Faustovirus]|nr:hypothetical protein F-VV10_0365 [Faustovirus]